MAQLTVQTINLGLASGTYAGLAPTYVAAATGGDTFLNLDKRTFLAVINAGGSPITVTINSIRKCNQGHDHDPAISVAATTGVKWIGPFNPNDFNDGNFLVSVTYSAVTSVTVGAFSLSDVDRS